MYLPTHFFSLDVQTVSSKHHYKTKIYVRFYICVYILCCDNSAIHCVYIFCAVYNSAKKKQRQSCFVNKELPFFEILELFVVLFENLKIK